MINDGGCSFANSHRCLQLYQYLFWINKNSQNPTSQIHDYYLKRMILGCCKLYKLTCLRVLNQHIQCWKLTASSKFVFQDKVVAIRISIVNVIGMFSGGCAAVT